MNHESRESGGLQAFDPRECSGICNTQDGVKILYDAPKISGKTRTILHTVIAHHTNDNCVEICCVHVRLNIESPRIYVDYTKLKNTIDPELYNTRLMALKEEIKQQRREYKPQKAALQVSNELVLEYLMRRLHLSEECSEVHGVFMMDLRIVAGDATKVIPHPDDFEVKLTVSDILCEKPRALLPVKLNYSILSDHWLALSSKQSLPVLAEPIKISEQFLYEEDEKRRQSEFKFLRDLSVEDLVTSLNVQYHDLHSPAWTRWKQIIAKVITRKVLLPKIKERIKRSCVAEWYLEVIRIKSENMERDRRRQQQDERIKTIANATVPKKVFHVRPCYSVQAMELEKQKRESIRQLDSSFYAPSNSTIEKIKTPKKSHRIRRHSITINSNQSKERKPSLLHHSNHTSKHHIDLKKLPHINKEPNTLKKEVKKSSAVTFSLKRRHSYDSHVRKQLQGYLDREKLLEAHHTNDTNPHLSSHFLTSGRNVKSQMQQSDSPPSLLQTYGTYAKKVNDMVPLEAFSHPLPRSWSHQSGSNDDYDINHHDVKGYHHIHHEQIHHHDYQNHHHRHHDYHKQHHGTYLKHGIDSHRSSHDADDKNFLHGSRSSEHYTPEKSTALLNQLFKRQVKVDDTEHYSSRTSSFNKEDSFDRHSRSSSFAGDHDITTIDDHDDEQMHLPHIS